MSQTIAVTAATGHLGELVIDELLQRVPAEQVVAVVRNPEKAESIAEKGVDVRVASYDDPAALRAALEGVDRVLLISGNEIGQRVPQHTNVVEAAKDARRLVHRLHERPQGLRHRPHPRARAQGDRGGRPGLRHPVLDHAQQLVLRELRRHSWRPRRRPARSSGSTHGGRIPAVPRRTWLPATPPS